MSNYPTSAGCPPSTAPLMIDGRGAEIAELKRLLNAAGVVEIGARNPNVASYCDHWERRAEKAEAALSERESELQQLRGRHSTTHVPTLERIKRAHTAMPLSTWASDETAQHRTYYQGDNEQCYLCALIIQLEAAEKVASEREKELARLRSALNKYGRHFISCAKPHSYHKECDCGFEAALSPSQESSEKPTQGETKP